ncbi:plant UBX domain-containing protein 7-like [Phoenix dactylifera]|uniref:Plant UBX domain-containing protein 7-like n=1 Tax=Phoenix dactylifera TaxID=42345 RepID=A0A8B8J8W0_PHODC|nr:plant UBX domain-containing protein 7-like [Phoenix dactylifera]
MEDFPSSSEKEVLISSFLEIATGFSSDAAINYLQATNWRLEDAFELFFAGGEPGTAFSDDRARDDGVRPPIPLKREVLYGPAPSLLSQCFDAESSVWKSEGGESNCSILASLFRPPSCLIYHGSFHDAKVAASSENRWLLVNLQNMEEFSSHMLNRDTWSNETMVHMIQANFVFWQANHDTDGGKKVCTYYKLISSPAILVIDPITGQKMRSWSGMRTADALLEDLLPFVDGGPKEHHDVLSRKQSVHATELGLREAASTEGTSAGDRIGADKDIMEASMNAKLEYLHLPEEPKGEKGVTCRVAIRLPDGRRLQRNFLRSDPIKLLWSFCSSGLEEGNMRRFRFVQTTSGGSNSLEYESNLTFEEAGFSNSMISMVWK